MIFMGQKVGTCQKRIMLELLRRMLKNIAKSNQRLPTHCNTPIMSGYRPETNTSVKLKDEGAK